MSEEQMMNTDRLIKYVSDGVDAAKRGEACAVYAQVKPWHDKGMLPARSHYAFGWIIYYAIHQSADSDIEGRKRMLACYLKLSVPRPHKLHSMILTEAIRLYKNAKEKSFKFRDNRERSPESFSIVRFCDIWGLQNLRPGDWRRKEHEGKLLSSTVEKLITQYADELESTGTAPTADFQKVMNQASTEYPDSYNLHSQQAMLLMRESRYEEAAALLRRALLSAPGKFFLWSRLAEAVGHRGDYRLQSALLYKALKSPGDERFKGKVHMSLARIWIEVKAYGYALWELKRVREIYESNGWHLPSEAGAMIRKIPEGQAAEDPEPLYRRIELLADNEIYASLPVVSARKCYHRETESDGRFAPRGVRRISWGVRDGEGKIHWFQPSRFRIDPSLPEGTEVELRIYNGKPVTASLADPEKK